MTDALLDNARLLAGLLLAGWLLGVAIGKVSFIDSVWGLAMAALAVASFLAGKPGDAALLLTVMVVAWGTRLGMHLLRRFLRNGEDARYRRMLPDPANRVSYAITALWKVVLLQGVLIMLVSSPAQVGIIAAQPEQPISPWALAGVALYLVGIVFEWVGDWQLARFKAAPGNEGKVMDAGLWRYTRHPNYFGDACAWWGIWLAAMSVAPAAVIWTLPGPIFLTFTLVKWSGAVMTEDAMHEKYGEKFAAYVRRTSAFIPLPPRSTAKSTQKAHTGENE